MPISLAVSLITCDLIMKLECGSTKCSLRDQKVCLQLYALLQTRHSRQLEIAIAQAELAFHILQHPHSST